MELKWLKEDHCPVCKCDVVVEESIELPETSTMAKLTELYNGKRREHRRFLCGFEYVYDPNFDNSYPSSKHKCCFDPELLAMKLKLENEKKKLVEFLDTVDLTENIKEDLKSRLSLY